MISFMLLSFCVINLIQCTSPLTSENFSDFPDLNPAEQRTIVADNRRKWPHKYIMYKLDTAFSEDEKASIQAAAEEIKDHTCVRWIKLQSIIDFDYVSIEKSDKCEAEEGRLGGEQKLYLSSDCSMDKGIVLHLLLHTLGLRHEHQRPDRDEYITINFSNIIEGAEHLFTKHEADEANMLNLEYNYRSVMHYSSFTNAKNKSVPVITPKHSDVSTTDLGDGLKQGYLTEMDIYNINWFYQCRWYLERQ